ncbi:MAG: sulfonate ABC transporter ATP-binding protein [Candidatus Methanoperedens nitroreducens]|uniref:Sulfonate ABC transporter ATP-binding protein n=1 Tax=Candidatus Methanoperedens nitratireducens TaxID=1392998 RepID=A0A0P8C433_9EURY|nr:ABC transporter ATP-binding protein [Candidatus Methanoperedens sp. BLZ2]KAB2947801.1 MAG: ABC transporter ATP-binding protein [Candidatus Methanoperedens sp.]KPQ41329.1 MAG: sulfonate ABC transporter ATP-binding protein [Candidatus Methanoperedens sp. BLZ1]MBZ0175201.1 ABC transporter ATP-binding protein [Candidatus Methanoperedens nitroreducens]MCX9076473.1 ABC transporter ATP-binding protein [Candidatus Methanoperedens sp.]
MGRLVFSSVSRKFNNFQALLDVNFEVENGEFVCLLGPSGCGKTTILRLAAGLVAPDEGIISLDGKKIDGVNKECGFVFQEYALFPWRTVKENIEFGPQVKGMTKTECESISKHYIDLVGLNGFENHYPNELSGGMKQRVGIARAYANNPKLLLMDEPFGALDAQTRNLMQGELLRIWETEHISVLFVTHSVDEAVYLGDRVIVMSARPGKVKDIFDVKLTRPRIRTGPEANIIRDSVLKSLSTQIKLASHEYI